MKVEFWMIGKTSFDYLDDGIAIYKKRLGHYLPFSSTVIPNIKNAKKLSTKEIKEKEGALVLGKINKDDFLILLDEKGKHYSSQKFASFMEGKLQHSGKRIIFLVGGAYGFSDIVYTRANSQLSLSAMTFSHQMIRLFFLEQLYRAMTIIRNEPYHNQ